jgi:hypothetical protein
MDGAKLNADSMARNNSIESERLAHHLRVEGDAYQAELAALRAEHEHLGDCFRDAESSYVALRAEVNAYIDIHSNTHTIQYTDQYSYANTGTIANRDSVFHAYFNFYPYQYSHSDTIEYTYCDIHANTHTVQHAD